MEVFRISQDQYSKKLFASGRSNRWNVKGQQVIYAGSSRSLSTLELIVHTSAVQPLANYRIMVISIADDDHLIKQIHIGDLPSDWRSFAAYSQLQKIGSDWMNSQETLILKVPSAVVPMEYNYLINLEHPLYKKNITLIRTETYFWDARLI